MYAINPNQQYAYAVPPPRQYAAHGTSSAYSTSANPDEDWTKISDLAERRRIQNRIAQRNYRKKLKKRLEDLERRAGSSEGSPPPEKLIKGAKKSVSPTAKAHPKSLVSPKAAHHHQPSHQPTQQYTPPMHSDDELSYSQSYDERDRSHSPTYMPYASYPAQDSYQPYESQAQAPYYHQQQQQQQQQHHHLPTPITTGGVYQSYMAPVNTVTLPSMSHFNEAVEVKREAYPEEPISGSYNVNYGYAGGYYEHSPQGPHTPPLSYGSSSGSEFNFEYPHTPLSMPPSPDLVKQQ